MAFTGDVRVNQNGVVPSARTLTNAAPLDVALVDASGDQLVGFDPSRPATATLTQVPLSVTSVTLVAANAARRGLVIFNRSSRELYVAFGATASTTAFTVRLPGFGAWELPLSGYTGDISGIWGQNGTGDAQITELTA